VSYIFETSKKQVNLHLNFRWKIKASEPSNCRRVWSQLVGKFCRNFLETLSNLLLRVSYDAER